MTPKERRDRLFRKHRPTIRDFVEDDLKWLRTGLKVSGIEKTDDEFYEFVDDQFQQYNKYLTVEDQNGQFKSGEGPVCLVGAKSNGWLYEPHVEWFPWATNRNKLVCTVAFLQKYRYQKIGVIRIHALNEDNDFFRKMINFVPLKRLGNIPGGDELGRGDDNIFYMKGRGQRNE